MFDGIEPREVVDALKESDRLLLARFAPAGVLVSPAMEIVQYRGDVGAYMAPVPGKASLNLLKMLGNGLQVAIRSAIVRSKKKNAVRTEGVRVRSNDGGVRSVTVELIPVRAGNGGFLVLFEEPGIRHGGGHPAAAGPTRVRKGRSRDRGRSRT